MSFTTSHLTERRSPHRWRHEHAPLPHWRLKAATQWALSGVPGGERLNHLLQRKVTRKYPRRPAAFALNLRITAGHYAAFGRHGRKRPNEAAFFEFGAGWDLLGPLLLSRLGVARQTVVDLRVNASAVLIRDALRRLAEAGPQYAGGPLAPGDDLEKLLAPLAIQYLAPCDARATGLPDGAHDCIVSTNTLEHVPAGQLPALLTELRRILAPGGIASLHIDYQDHYAYFDRRLSSFHFLSYSAARWRRWNPSLHFQNRLRHDEWRGLFARAGFAVLEDRPGDPRPQDIAALREQALAPEFAGLALERLAIPSAHWVLGGGPENHSGQPAS